MQVLLDNNRQKEWEADVTAVWMSNFYVQKSPKKQNAANTTNPEQKLQYNDVSEECSNV